MFVQDRKINALRNLLQSVPATNGLSILSPPTCRPNIYALLPKILFLLRRCKGKSCNTDSSKAKILNKSNCTDVPTAMMAEETEIVIKQKRIDVIPRQLRHNIRKLSLIFKNQNFVSRAGVGTRKAF
jgi:hypothetical protein